MDKKELILAEAARLFAEKGYYGLGLTELLKRCDIPKGSFYYYFPNGKLQLIQEVLEFSYHRMRGFMEMCLRCPTAMAGFSMMVDSLIDGIQQKRQLYSMLLSMIAIESVYLDEEINALCKRIYSDWQQLYADGLVHFGMEPQHARRKAQVLFALIHGSLISSWIKQDAGDLLLAKQSLEDILR